MTVIRVRGAAALGWALAIGWLWVGAAWGQGQPLGPDPTLVFEGRMGYAATADTLIRCGGSACGLGGPECQGLDSSTVTLDSLPESETLRVVHARLNWAASTPVDEMPDMQVTLTPPGGEPIAVAADPLLSERFEDGLAAGECGVFGGICPVPFDCDLGFYSNHADITRAVEMHRVAGGALNGQWTFSDVDIPGSADDDPATAVAALGSLTIGAWSMLVVYEDAMTQPTRRIYYYQGFELNSGTPRRLFPRGFDAPPPDPVVDLTIMVLEGDTDVRGDQLTVNGRQISDGCNPIDNVFNSTVNTGTADGRCRQGVHGTDLDRFRVVGAIDAGDDEAEIVLQIPRGDGLFNAGEQLFTNWIVLAFDHLLPDFEGLKPEKEAVPASGAFVARGSAIQYRIQVDNDGDGPAVGVVVRDPLSPLLDYVPGSTLIDGQPVPDGPGGAFPLQDGLELTLLPQVGETIEVGEVHRLAFSAQVRRDAPHGAMIRNVATIEAELIEPLETEAVVHVVDVPDGGMPPPDAEVPDLDAEAPGPDAGPRPDARVPLRDGGGPARDGGTPDPRVDGGALLGDADLSNPCGPGTRLNAEGFCVSICGEGLRWDPTCEPGRCVHEDEADCDGGGGSPGGGCGGCDAADGPAPAAWLAVLVALGWRRRRRG